MPSRKKETATVYTIGHSTHPLDEFIEILMAYKIGTLVDVRSLPGSTYVPQYNQENLEVELSKHKIQYRYLEKLGGRRRNRVKSHSENIVNTLNTGWRNTSFRNYADYMQTEEFEEGIKELKEIISNGIVAIMCAEALPWRCHRRMIGDALLVRGYSVVDIFSANKAEAETITEFARVEKERITYPKLKDAK